MKVFLSWSGHKSHEVALAFKEWLPYVIQSITPFVSSEDIDKGARWSSDIAKELEDSSFSILCVTRDNVEAPWLHFEAGALSKIIDKSYVCPFLFDLKSSEMNGPLLQFQSTSNDREDILKLVQSINKASDKDVLLEERLSSTFELWWPKLEEKFNKISSETDNKGESPKKNNRVSETAMLEEILELSRMTQKLLRNPMSTLPADFSPSDISIQLERLFHISIRLIERAKIMRVELEQFYEGQVIVDEKLTVMCKELEDEIKFYSMDIRRMYMRFPK